MRAPACSGPTRSPIYPSGRPGRESELDHPHPRPSRPARPGRWRMARRAHAKAPSERHAPMFGTGASPRNSVANTSIWQPGARACYRGLLPLRGKRGSTGLDLRPDAFGGRDIRCTGDSAGNAADALERSQARTSSPETSSESTAPHAVASRATARKCWRSMARPGDTTNRLFSTTAACCCVPIPREGSVQHACRRAAP
jgi:hypothetical protein